MKKIITEAFPIQTSDGTIYGLYLPSGKVQINKGSFFRNFEVPSLRAEHRNTRKYLIVNGYVDLEKGVLVKDYIFKNPSEAISCLIGGMESGNRKFFTKDNIELGTYLETDIIEGTEELQEKYKTMKMIVCNITWMEKYDGPELVSFSGFKYVQEHGLGHELFNYHKEDDGYYYGFVERKNKKINLERIDPNNNGQYVDGVLVVWISNLNGTKCIVGYYKNARVFGTVQDRHNGTEYSDYYIRALIADSYLLPPKERKFVIPTAGENRPGQNPVWYGDNEKLKIDIIKYVMEIDSKKERIAKHALVDEDDKYGVISTDDVDDEKPIVAYKPVKKPIKQLNSGISYQRSEKVAKNAVKLANFKCELNESHITFITKNGKPYMEAHHLIPLGDQDEFDNSLDVEANVVCLCPNCHRMLHYGKNIGNELSTLLNKRKKLLSQQGIEISLEELLEYYNN